LFRRPFDLCGGFRNAGVNRVREVIAEVLNLIRELREHIAIRD